MPTPEWPDGISGARNWNIDSQSVRPAELHSAEDGSGLQATLGAQAYVPLAATRTRVAMMRVPATNVPRNVPETFDSPPIRLR
jgi:hypothetical protein